MKRAPLLSSTSGSSNHCVASSRLPSEAELVAFDHVDLVAMVRGQLLVIVDGGEMGSVDDQLVAFPMADRVAHLRVRVVRTGMAAAVHER
jgi:hypothetical protein